ncbi:unnamed protein product, partial [Ilex paraguariensis]
MCSLLSRWWRLCTLVEDVLVAGGGCGRWWRICSLVDAVVAGGWFSDDLPRRRVAEEEERAE